MSNEKQKINPEGFKAQLEEQKKAALTNANELIREKLETLAQLAKGEHMLVPTNIITDGNFLVYNDPMMQAYLEKANELTREFEKLADQEQGAYLLARQKVIFANWQNRLSLILDLNDKNNRDPDLSEIRNRGVALIQSISIPEFMAQNLRGPLREAYIQQIEERGKTVAPDLNNTLQRLARGEIKEEDWPVIIEHLRNLTVSKKDWVENTAAMAIVGAIPPHLRPELLRQLQKKLDSENAAHSYESLVSALLLGNYLTIAQVETVIKAQIETAKAEHKDIIPLETFLLKIQDPKLLKIQEKMEEAQVEGVKRWRKNRQIGHRNSTRELLTIEGITGTLLAVTGLTGGLVNVGMKASSGEWNEIFNNATIMSLGMMGAGLEMNNGFGGIMDTPTTQLGQIFQGKDAQREQDKLMAQNAFERKVMRHPRAQELYFQFAEKINESYKLKSRKYHSAQVHLTMEEMGINWEALPPEYSKMNKQETEAVLSEWVFQMAGDERFAQSISTQKLFVGGDPSNTNRVKSDCRVKYGLRPLEEWLPEIKARYRFSSN